MYTILARELQNESAERNFPLLRYLRRDENTACTFQNLSFIQAKRWVVENPHFLTKFDHQKPQSTAIKNAAAKSHFSHFFCSRTLQKQCSRSDGVTISENGLGN